MKKKSRGKSEDPQPPQEAPPSPSPPWRGTIHVRSMQWTDAKGRQGIRRCLSIAISPGPPRSTPIEPKEEVSSSTSISTALIEVKKKNSSSTSVRAVVVSGG